MHFLSEGKTQKYMKYALGEIFLVMVGILLALQVNNWNENRKTNQQEVELLESLQTEFTFNKEELERCITKAKAIQKSCERLLENTGNKGMNLSPSESDSLLSVGLLNIITFDPGNGILNDIINSGKIHVLKNEKLKNILSNWDGMLNDVKEDETWAVNERNRITFPFIYKHSNYVNISRNGIKDNLITSGFTTDYQDIYRLLEFENLVNSHRIWNKKNERNYRMLKQTVDEIIRLCQQEISFKK